MAPNAPVLISPVPSEVQAAVVIGCLLILVVICSYISWTVFKREHRQVPKDIDNGQNEDHLHPGPLAAPIEIIEPRINFAADPAHQLPTQDNTVEMDGTGRPAELAVALRAYQRPQAARA